jgi:hypothetical protein
MAKKSFDGVAPVHLEICTNMDCALKYIDEHEGISLFSTRWITEDDLPLMGDGLL